MFLSADCTMLGLPPAVTIVEKKFGLARLEAQSLFERGPWCAILSTDQDTPDIEDDCFDHKEFPNRCGSFKHKLSWYT